MLNQNKNLIEYIGVSSYLPTNLKVFKKSSSKLNTKIPTTRPKIKSLTKVVLNISIKETSLINTPTGKSLEGLFLTGKKLICYGFITYKFHYISNEEKQNIQLYTIKHPFIESIIVPVHLKEEANITTSIFIDDITCNIINQNEIFSYASFVISCD